MKTVTIVGGVPAPVGGVTSYISRLINYFPEYFYQVLDLYPYVKKEVISNTLNIDHKIFKGLLSIGCIYELMKIKNGIVHFNFSTAKALFPLILIWKRSNVKWVLTLHNGKPDSNINQILPGFLLKYCFKYSLTKFDRISSLNDYQSNFYNKYDVYSECVIDMDTFVPYIKAISGDLPMSFVEFRKKHQRESIILMNGYGKRFYNFHLGVEFVNTNSDYLLVIVIYGDIDDVYYQELMYLIGDNDRVLIIEGIEQSIFLNLLGNVHIYLRANSIDSFGIAVADAVCMGKTAIASDVCKRFPGCYLYVDGEKEQLFNLLETKHLVNEEIDFNQEYYFKQLKNVYEKLYA